MNATGRGKRARPLRMVWLYSVAIYIALAVGLLALELGRVISAVQFVAVNAGLVGAMILVRQRWATRVQAKAAAAGYLVCCDCGYALGAGPERCPECGAAFELEEARRRWGAERRRRE